MCCSLTQRDTRTSSQENSGSVYLMRLPRRLVRIYIRGRVLSKGVGHVAATIEASLPNGTPMLGHSVPELPPEFPRIQVATDWSNQRGAATGGFAISAEGAGGPSGKKKDRPPGGVIYPWRLAQATQALSVSTRARELEASGCPRHFITGRARGVR